MVMIHVTFYAATQKANGAQTVRFLRDQEQQQLGDVLLLFLAEDKRAGKYLLTIASHVLVPYIILMEGCELDFTGHGGYGSIWVNTCWCSIKNVCNIPPILDKDR